METAKISVDEIKTLQFDILCYVDSFCRSNGIKYWLDCGSLIGAVRHKGFIPWDDDIDIGMLREDYENFIKAFPGTSNRYIFKSMEIDKDYYFAYGKVMDNKTVLYEPNRNGYKIAVNIDVFVYDNAPDDDRKMKRQYDMRDVWRMLNNAQTGLHRKTDNSFKEFAVAVSGVLLNIFPRGYFNKMLIKNSKKYANKNTKRVGNFTANARMACDKEVFREFIEVQFEGKSFPAPIGYDLWLKAFYGDYMKLPPVEKRVSQHEFEAYYIE